MTSFKYMGEFKDESILPKRVQEGAIMFKEPDMNKFAIIANLLSLVLLIGLVVFTFFYAGRQYNTWGQWHQFCFLYHMNFYMRYG